MRLALDATYSLGSALTGVGVYSREILNGLALGHSSQRFDWFYRSQRYWRARGLDLPANVTRRLLTESWGSRSARLFHGLNQRLPKRRFRAQVATFHDLFVLSSQYSTAEFRERFAQQARQAAAGADLIIAVSAFTASQVETLLNVPRSRIRVIHHGVVPRALAQLPRQKMVLCVGAIQRRKNQARLIRAFARMPDDWTLVLAGSEGFEGGEAARAAAISPAASRIRLTGYVDEDEIARLYAQASIFAFPSLDEGFGMPVLEAMAAKVCVLAGNNSAIPEVCGNAAELVDAQDENAIADGLVKLATDEHCRTRLVTAGIQRAAQFRWEDAVAKTWNVYRELLPEL